MDKLTKEQRHKNMKNIHAKDTKIEIILRKALWHKGYRFRKNYQKLPGSPDISYIPFLPVSDCSLTLSEGTQVCGFVLASAIDTLYTYNSSHALSA